ncbi:molecular chaperone [Sphingomonas sp. GCM10030256]|uniref:fimbrial biogenesis chaperone n=1 Tax=Sphingomonas sp. GCM10030256 TaxID=3273427 RepID=UPI003622A90C
MMILALLMPAVATAMTVQPVVLNLSPGGRNITQVLTVTNTFTYPLAVELRVEELTAEASGVRSTGKDPGDLVVFPPTALIQPGQTQTFRVQYVGNPALARSKHYYVNVAQLPVKQQQGQSAVQVLYNFQVLASVSPTGAKPAIKVDSAAFERTGDGKFVPAITFSNASTAHGFLAGGKIRVVQKDAAGKEIFRREFTAPEVQQAIGYGLMGAGQVRKVTLPVELPSNAGRIEAQYTPAG